MSIDLVKGFVDAVTDQNSVAQYAVGAKRFQNGKTYEYIQANATITANQAVQIDTVDNKGNKVIPTAAAGDLVFGVAEIAVTSGNFFWCTTRGAAISCKILTATTVKGLLGATSTAGVLGIVSTVDARGYALEAGAATNLAKNIQLF